MKRRDFLRTASGVSGAAAAVGAASAGAAAEDQGRSGAPNNTTTTGAPNGTGSANNTTAGGGAPSGPTKEVVVGPGGSLVYEPADLTIANGTTVNFVWDSDNHNIVVDGQPEGAGWEGTPGADSKTYNTGYEYSHTFTTNGEYQYYCQPHVGAGMEASITVKDTVASGGGKEQDPEHMGVPFQAHFVGLATILAIISSLLFTFYTLKYGESAHTAAPNKD
ncbi:plastocyanin/azurin family copper-binding protein [Halorubellus sp. PRR65]|uniref:plastocyanin/azurin family copper-binding protein n=1 Tax=Halorubellus sp. PRR65 TaxID=3098148 RepID=UPI002B25E7B8|nr:plastocyanin/azurin family copper-binding protein [Halorubellus sp. PRR65]